MYMFHTSGYIFAIGGFDGTLTLKSEEQYSPYKGKWTAIADTSYRRFGMGVCSVDDMISCLSTTCYYLPVCGLIKEATLEIL